MLKIFFKRVFVGVLLITTINSFAQEYDFKHFTTKNGLPHNYINDIYQDSEGFIWLATRSGVCRYDGYNFQIFSTKQKDNSIIPSFSKKIFEADDGKLWVFGAKLYSYYYQKNNFYTYSDDFTFAYPDKNGNIWFVNDSSIINIDLKSAEIANDRDIKKTRLLRLICKERDNKVWAFRNFTLNDLINSSKGFYNIYSFKKDNNSTYYINNTFVDSGNNIWISTGNKGIIKFDSETEKLEYYTNNKEINNQLSHNYIYSISEVDGKIFIGTMNGINVFDKETKEISYIKKEDFKKSSLSDDVVTCFLQDRSGVLFIGTRYGLNIANRKKFHHYYKIDGKTSITNNNVHGFIEDESKNIWIISSGGLDKMNIENSKFINYPVNSLNNNSLKASPISITSDANNNLWIGTWQGGLSHYNIKSNSFTNYTYNNNKSNTITNNSIMSLFRDSKNNIWIGTWGGGLNIFDKNKNEFISYKKDWNDKNSLSDNEVSSFAEDSYGRIWIGTSNGLNLLIDRNERIFKHFENNPLDSNSISNNRINALFEKNNILWIGTELGLNKLDLKNFSIDKIDIKDGLPSNTIKAIVDDNQGNLWVSTNKGLAKIEFKNNLEINQIISFTTSDGLQDEEFLNRSVYKLSSGKLLFGGTNGFNSFNPTEISLDTITPQCSFTKLLVDNVEIKEDDLVFNKKVILSPISKSKDIQLSHKHKSFSIEFTGLYFLEPNLINYKYMLKGFDKEWKIVDSKHRVATYTNINKGKYEFIVKAANSDNYWGNPISIIIEVIPPFWRTTWFTILFYLFIIIVIYLFIELRIRIIKRQKKRLKKIVEKRTAEISEQKDGIEKQKDEIKQQALQIKEMNILLRKHNLELKGNIENLSKARVMQKLLDYVEFKKIFKDETACEEYLMDLKWGKGFSCIRCSNSDYSVEDYNARRCRKCNYKESITSGTIFHHLRFPIDKALYILIVTSTRRKINVSELSRTLELRLKTVWNFHNKVKEELSLLKSPIKSDEGWNKLIITPKKRSYK